MPIEKAHSSTPMARARSQLSDKHQYESRALAAGDAHAQLTGGTCVSHTRMARCNEQ